MIAELSMGLGALSSLSGLLGGNAAARRAAEARRQALNKISISIDEDYNAAMRSTNNAMYGSAGTAADAIRSLGGRLGDAMGNAGVWNSSATAGALVQAQRDANSAIGRMAVENLDNARSNRSQGLRSLAGMQVDMANQDLSNANAQKAAGVSGLTSFLGSLAQYNLAKSGANLEQSSLPREAGGYGGTGTLPVEAGYGKGFGAPTLGTVPAMGSSFPTSSGYGSGFGTASMNSNVLRFGKYPQLASLPQPIRRRTR